MRIGVVCPELRRHLDATSVLARELARRGHDVTVLAAPRARACVEGAGLRLLPIGVPEDADGTAASAWAESAKSTGAAGARATARAFAALARVQARDLPSALDAAGIEGLLVDEACPAAAAVAESRGLPYVVACPTLAGPSSDDAPPPSTRLRIATGRLARWRNRTVARVTRRVIDRWAARHGPPGIFPLDLVFSPERGLARVTPMPQFFDVPRHVRPDRLHHTGPWSRSPREAPPDAWEAPTTGGPLVLVRVGTPSTRTDVVLESLARAAARVPCTLLRCRGDDASGTRASTGGAFHRMPEAPAGRALARAAALVTDADLDRALEGLASGVPLVCVPSCQDQPGVARRVERLGAGIVVPAASATPDRLRAAIERVLREPSFRERAAAARRAIAGVHGVRHAADVIERALLGGRPVTAPGAAQAV